jgi:signal transduction histidine kinase
VRRLGLLVWPAAIGLGIAAESVAFSWDDPRRWLPDLIVGLAFIGCGFVAWQRRGRRDIGALLAATGVAWFLGNFDEALLYLHRGPLVHLILAYPGWRPRSRLDLVAVAAGYAAALAWPVWQSEAANIVLGLALPAVAARGYLVATGREKRWRLVALQAAGALGVVLAGGAVARLAFPAGDAADPALLAYQAALCAVAVLLLSRLGSPAAATVADLVVELGETRAGTLRDRLARGLGDPTLEVGYWSAETRVYLDDSGRELALPEQDGTRSATFVEREGLPFAALVHDSAVLGDPVLVDAVASATRLATSNATLQAEVRAQVAELNASRRRLLVAAGEERQRLEERLREGPERRLANLEEALSRVRPLPDGEANEHVERARTQLFRTREELQELARGLHPHELVEDGLAGALGSLAERAPVPVELDILAERLPPEHEATVYFFCAEALANVAKHASASRVELSVERRDGHVAVVISDDGVGGADTSGGTGLQGLADRVEALGGTLHVASPPGQGTRLSAEIPVPERR